MNDLKNDSEHAEVHEEPRVMTDDDVHEYQGLTLDENGQEEKKEEKEDFVIHIHSFSFHNMPWWKKGLYIAGAIALFAFLLFLAIATAWIFVIGGGVALIALFILYVIRKYIL